MTMKKVFGVVGLLCVLSSAAGCGSSDQGETADQAAADGTPVRRATAWVNPTEGYEGGGSAIFINEGERVDLQVSFQKMESGVHALHVHEIGDCSAPDGSSAGGHWNPMGHEHGKWGEGSFHLGDVGNITIGEDGEGTLSFSSEHWTMGTGADNDVMGKALIVHAGVDDFTTQPTGAAGKRIACGVIK
jgi:Cu-Zn family superoxide dismutase